MRLAVIFILFCAPANGQHVINSYAFVSEPPGDALDAPDSQVSRWNATDEGADNSVISTLSDKWTAGHDLTAQGAGDVLVNVAALDGVKEVEFTGLNYMNVSADHSEYDIDPSVDTQTIVFIQGELAPNSFEQIINKGNNNSSEINGVWGFRTVSGGAMRPYSSGNQATAVTPAGTINVYFIEVDAGTIRFFVNSTTADRTFSSTTSDNDNNVLTVGARTDGSSSMEGSWREIAIYSDLLTVQEKQDILDEFSQ